MYYYRGLKIGTRDEAEKKIGSERNMTWSLLGTYLDTAAENALSDMILEQVIEGATITKEGLILDALDYLAELWMEDGNWSQTPGDRAIMGDFEYENWEEEE